MTGVQTCALPIWRIPLQNLTSNAYVYASKFISDEAAQSGLMDNLEGRSLADPVVAPFVNGRSRKVFHKNVVAVGGAAGFLEPLESTGLHLVQSGLSRLLALWPTRECEAVIAREYNDVTAKEWDLARDFLVLHYQATSRTDSPLWRACKDIVVSTSLQARLEHWIAFGRLISPQAELFQPASWLSVLVGQGIAPKAYDPLADARENQVDFQARLLGLERVIAETASQMPPHRDWIEKNARGLRL